MNCSVSIQEISSELDIVLKDAERSRKQLKDSGNRHRKQLEVEEAALERVYSFIDILLIFKLKLKSDISAEELDRIRLNGQIRYRETQLHDISSMKKPSLFNINIFQKKRSDEEVIKNAVQANTAFKNQLEYTNSLRQTYFSQHLPSLLKVI